MPQQIFDPPERFVAGTVGPPGQRTFFLQAAGDGRLVSMSLEKQQVQVLADRCNDLLDSYAPITGSDAAASALVDNEPLGTPIEDEFRVQSIGLAYEPGRDVVVIDCSDGDLEEQAAAEEAGLEPEPGAAPQLVRVVLAPPAARAFARRSLALVAAGRAPCPFCGEPLDPEGHICPRANGYKR
ncbi:DUF3090 domain-containing protein [Arsenicicoccus sp. oral taxon 190]|uniref:DUF3090 domain-containing protein n=1 Tax=Arsenicicoccus sp. oral taxon 190 TaxID=1658671 RepID=UPI00067A2257|nr:DUF3090 domain-containing protein [Arsenicicoccus sp. oral taxon 190]AKT51926.1 hypothetical protein ADJ73_12740 [Arsenicicoccus sp. oral taxon 190]